MVHNGMPLEFRKWTVSWASDIANKIVSNALNKRSPSYVVRERDPEIFHPKPFDCKAFAHEDNLDALKRWQNHANWWLCLDMILLGRRTGYASKMLKEEMRCLVRSRFLIVIVTLPQRLLPLLSSCFKMMNLILVQWSNGRKCQVWWAGWWI